MAELFPLDVSNIGSYSGSFSGSFFGDGSGLTGISASNAISASYAATASYLLGSVTSASYALTASFATNHKTITGSYFAQGKLSANQLIATGSDVIIQFVDDFDPQNWWNTSTYRFTPNITGYYNVLFGVWFENMAASSSVQVNAQARKNGNSFMLIQQPCNVGTGISLTGAKIIYLNGSTDYLDFTAYNGAFVSKNIQQGTADGSGTWFSAILITQ